MSNMKHIRWSVICGSVNIKPRSYVCDNAKETYNKIKADKA